MRASKQNRLDSLGERGKHRQCFILDGRHQNVMSGEFLQREEARNLVQSILFGFQNKFLILFKSRAKPRIFRHAEQAHPYAVENQSAIVLNAAGHDLLRLVPNLFHPRNRHARRQLHRAHT